MRLLKIIICRLKKFNQELNNHDGVTWLEYRRQWLEENNIKCN